MSNTTVMFLGERDQIAFLGRNCLCVSAEHPNPMYVNPTYPDRVIVSGLSDPSLLATCPFGIHFAFWSFSGESFTLVDINGNQIWSARMNSDKAVPKWVRFSNSGDAVACEYWFDGVPGMFFCDYWKEYATTFGCSGSPIGYDANLQYFAIDGCDPFEDDKLAFFKQEPDSGNIIKVPPQDISRNLEQHPLLVDRYRRVIESPVVPMRNWQALAIRDELNGFIILKDGDLYWFKKQNAEPDAVHHCHDKKEGWDWFHAKLTLSGDNVLIQSKKAQAMIVNRTAGVVWSGTNLISTLIKKQKILAQYGNGAIKVFRLDGSLEMAYQAPKGFHPVTATIRDDTLIVACIGEISGGIVFKSVELEKAT